METTEPMKSVDEIVEEYKKRHPCINSMCDGEGTLTLADFNNEPYPEQCEYCYRKRFEDIEWLTEALHSYTASRELKVREEEIDALDKWLWENGITHKESAQALQRYIRSRQALINPNVTTE